MIEFTSSRGGWIFVLFIFAMVITTLPSLAKVNENTDSYSPDEVDVESTSKYLNK